MRLLKGHTQRAWCVVFSPDGKLLASGGEDHTVRLWDVATGRARVTLKGHTARVRAVAFSPDGKVLASAGADKSIRLWDVSAGRAIAVLTEGGGEILALAFTPDGKRLAAAERYRGVTLWEMPAQKFAGFLADAKALAAPPLSLAVASDGKWLATGNWDGSVTVWDVAAERVRYRLAGQAEAGSVYAVAFDPDSHTLASLYADGRAAVWDVTTGKQQRLWAAHNLDGFALVFGAGGRMLVSAGTGYHEKGPEGNGEVRLWEAKTGKPRSVLTGCGDCVYSVAVTADGARVAVAGEESGAVRIWTPSPNP